MPGHAPGRFLRVEEDSTELFLAPQGGLHFAVRTQHDVGELRGKVYVGDEAGRKILQQEQDSRSTITSRSLPG